MSIQASQKEDDQLHTETIHELSERFHVDEATIREIYENKLAELRYQATITSFLPVLIERYVKSQLQYTGELAH